MSRITRCVCSKTSLRLPSSLGERIFMVVFDAHVGKRKASNMGNHLLCTWSNSPTRMRISEHSLRTTTIFQHSSPRTKPIDWLLGAPGPYLVYVEDREFEAWHLVDCWHLSPTRTTWYANYIVNASPNKDTDGILFTTSTWQRKTKKMRDVRGQFEKVPKGKSKEHATGPWRAGTCNQEEAPYLVLCGQSLVISQEK